MITSKHIITLDQMSKKKRLRERLMMQGRCRNCFKPLDSTSKCRCRVCLEKDVAKKRRKQERWEKEGLCKYCGRPVEQGYKYHNRNECVPSRRVRI